MCAPYGRCDGLCCIVFGPGDSTTRFNRDMQEIERSLGQFFPGVPPVVPPTSRMPDPCECCGKIHEKKSKTLGERLHAAH